MTDYPKRLIKVDLPIKRISARARRYLTWISIPGAVPILSAV